VTDLPLLAYANDGQVWNSALGVWEGPPVAADDRTVVGEWLDAGARIVGGCCGVGAAGIAGLRAWRDELPT
jgi:homocysteine S-methyltransferase